MNALLLRMACVCVLLGILVAGLWPFHAPANQVRWLHPGLSFGKYGSIVSANPIKPDLSGSDGACSLEIWLQPRRTRSSGTILAFYSDQRSIPFALRQSLGDLVIQRANSDQSNAAPTSKLYIDNLFERPHPVLVTITRDRSGITVYADGATVKKSSNFGLSIQDLTGTLIIGSSPVTTDEWSGELLGLAIYERELSADEVSRHASNRTAAGTLAMIDDKDLVARYDFNEESGSIVHNTAVASAHNPANSEYELLIPKRFFVLHEQFLEPPWDEYRPDWNYWKNVGINVGGFVPLGFFFFACFHYLEEIKPAAWLTVALGFAVSLTIEVLQAFLPTRDSGMTDLITNTLGTALGVLCCILMANSSLFARMFLSNPTIHQP